MGFLGWKPMYRLLSMSNRCSMQRLPKSATRSKPILSQWTVLIIRENRRWRHLARHNLEHALAPPKKNRCRESLNLRPPSPGLLLWTKVTTSSLVLLKYKAASPSYWGRTRFANCGFRRWDSAVAHRTNTLKTKMTIAQIQKVQLLYWISFIDPPGN